MKILFLQISDVHFNSNKFDEKYVLKIKSSLNEFGTTNKIFIILNGDLSFSGKNFELENVKKFVELLIQDIEDKVEILCVPGNHDLDHKDVLTSKDLNEIYKQNAYSNNIDVEEQKLDEFYKFSNEYNCFVENKNVDIKNYDLDGHNLMVCLVNSAPFSLMCDEDKGLHYLSNEDICLIDDNLNRNNLNIFVSHHPIEFYTDEIKNKLNKIISNKINVCMHAHEHNFFAKEIICNENHTIYQISGALCVGDDWRKSSYIISMIDTKSNNYKICEFKWNENNKIYERSETNYIIMPKTEESLSINDEFIKKLFENDFFNDKLKFEKYYIYPRLEKYNVKNTSIITNADEFIQNIKNEKKIVITGNRGSGKSALLKYIFTNLQKEKYVLYCDINLINKKSASNVISQTFYDCYGYNANKEEFDQKSIEDKVIIIDDADKINDGKLSGLFDYLTNYFGTVIIAANDSVDFDIVEKIKETTDNKPYFYKYRIMQLQEDKRLKLIKNVLSYKNIENIDNKTKFINEWLKMQKRHIPHTASFIIEFAEYYCRYGDNLNQSDSSIFGKVFEAKITNLINANINKKMTVDKIFTILSELAYFSHKNTYNVISEDNVIDILRKYNNDYSDKIEFIDFYNIVSSSNIYCYDNNKCGYKFVNNDYHSYFVAKKLNAKFQEDGDLADISYVINNSSQNINADILMFITYLTDNVRILMYLYQQAEDLTKNWDELDLNKLPEFMTKNLDDSLSQIKIESKEEREKILIEREIEEDYKIEIKDAYDYDEKNSELLMNQILRAMSLLSTISRCLPSFEHIMKKDLKDKYIDLIYKLPNRIYNAWLKEIDKNQLLLIEEYLDENGSYKYLEDQRKKVKDAYIFLRNSSIIVLLDIYYLAFSRAAKTNTFDYLESFKYDNNETYLIEHQMLLDKEEKYDKLIKNAISIKDKYKNQIVLILNARIIAHILPDVIENPRLKEEIFKNFIDKKNIKQKQIEAFKQNENKKNKL